jgi:hypothetical protein
LLEKSDSDSDESMPEVGDEEIGENDGPMSYDPFLCAANTGTVEDKSTKKEDNKNSDFSNK